MWCLNCQFHLCEERTPRRWMTVFSRRVFFRHIALFWGLGEMAAGTSNDYALLKSPECTSDECLLVKWECLKKLGHLDFFFMFVIVLLFLRQMA